MAKSIYILGAGGQGHLVYGLLVDLNMGGQVMGYVEDNSKRAGELSLGKPVYDSDILKNLDRNETLLVSGIGNSIRKNFIEKAKSMDYSFKTLIHPSVIKSQWLRTGEGVTIFAGVIIAPEVNIGDFSYVGISSIIGHDVNIGKYASISFGVNISGSVNIGDMTYIGVGTTIREKVSIGSGSFIGMGSLVTKDIPDHVLAYGSPAKVIKEINENDIKKFI